MTRKMSVVKKEKPAAETTENLLVDPIEKLPAEAREKVLAEATEKLLVDPIGKLPVVLIEKLLVAPTEKLLVAEATEKSLVEVIEISDEMMVVSTVIEMKEMKEAMIVAIVIMMAGETNRKYKKQKKKSIRKIFENPLNLFRANSGPRGEIRRAAPGAERPQEGGNWRSGTGPRTEEIKRREKTPPPAKCK